MQAACDGGKSPGRRQGSSLPSPVEKEARAPEMVKEDSRYVFRAGHILGDGTSIAAGRWGDTPIHTQDVPMLIVSGKDRLQ